MNGHGTHTAGTIAAASNGTGIVGVAPRVKIAGIKSSNNDGFFFPEMVICSFMWAATHGIHVTNNSYFADPWLFNCANDPVQRVIWEAERRAIRFAQSNGTVVVASEGNESTDLAPARRPDQPGLPAWQRPVPRDHERVAVGRGARGGRGDGYRQQGTEVLLLVVRRLDGRCRWRSAATRSSR